MEAQHNPLKNKNSKQSCQIKKSCPLYSGTERALCLLSPFPELRTSMLNNTEKTLARYSKQKSWNAHIRQLEAGLYCFAGNARPHSVRITQNLNEEFGREQFSPAIQPWSHDYRLSGKLVDFGERCFVSDDSAKNCVQQWLSSMPASFYEEGIKCSFE